MAQRWQTIVYKGRTFDSYQINRQDKWHKITHHFKAVKPHNGTGYPIAYLWADKKQRLVFVHTAVCSTWKRPRREGEHAFI